MIASIARWALILGIAGFLGGFVGPLVFTPGANQGPLLGIFITGPLWSCDWRDSRLGACPSRPIAMRSRLSRYSVGGTTDRRKTLLIPQTDRQMRQGRQR